MNTASLLTLFPCLLAAVGVGARADILTPGQKRVEHVVQFTNAPSFSNYYFLVYPRDLPRGQSGNSSVGLKDGAVVLSALNPLAVRQNRGAYLFAVPKSLYAQTGYPHEEWFTNATPGILKSQRLVDAIRSLPLSDPRERIITRYRIEGLPDKLDLILLEPQPVKPGETNALKKSDAAALLGLSGTAAVWIACDQFRRRRQPLARLGPGSI